MTTTQPGDWTTRAPRNLTDLTCVQGHVVEEPQDRRWLWRLATHLDTPGQRQLQMDLERYLTDTCTHHWHDRTPDDVRAMGTTLWQCIWCHRVETGEYPQAVAS
jgi:hypothetical protein